MKKGSGGAPGERPDVPDAEQQAAQSLVSRIAKATGLSPSEIARKAGLSPSTLTRLYPVASVNYTLSPRSLAKLQRAFPEAGGSPARGDSLSRLRPSDFRDARTAFDYPLRVGGVPIIRLTPTDDRPKALPDLQIELVTGDFTNPVGLLQGSLTTQSGDRYLAAYMPSESMEPRFRAGETLLIDRQRPAAASADVLVEFVRDSDAPLFAIARLVDRDRSHIRLIQHRYEASALIHRSAIAQLYAIIGQIDQ